MDTGTMIAVIVGVVLIATGIMIWLYFRNRSRKLQQRFGPEYERMVRETGDRRRAEAELEQREKRVDQLHIRPLPPPDQVRFAEQWRQVQTCFVDDPRRAVAQADALVGEVTNVRGYPVGDFDQRIADISVDHPQVVEDYRAAHAIALRHPHNGASREEANTEDLRQAMLHYRTLFEDLLGAREITIAEEARR
jgi:hypothetical protein